MDALSALIFQVEAGADEAIGEAPVDRLRRDVPASAQATRTATTVSPLPAKPMAPAQISTTDDVIARAARLAAEANTLDELRAAMERFDGCALRQTATQLVFADGTPGSSLIIVGEAPGRDEDIAGKPFVGRSGQLLDRMLATIGIDRRSAYIANTVPWRPPGNRKPTPMETQICRPFVERQIVLSGARIILLLGGASAAALFESQ